MGPARKYEFTKHHPAYLYDEDGIVRQSLLTPSSTSAFLKPSYYKLIIINDGTIENLLCSLFFLSPIFRHSVINSSSIIVDVSLCGAVMLYQPHHLQSPCYLQMLPSAVFTTIQLSRATTKLNHYETHQFRYYVEDIAKIKRPYCVIKWEKVRGDLTLLIKGRSDYKVRREIVGG